MLGNEPGNVVQFMFWKTAVPRQHDRTKPKLGDAWIPLHMDVDFCKLLPSPFWERGGGEGTGKSNKQGKPFFAQQPSP